MLRFRSGILGLLAAATAVAAMLCPAPARADDKAAVKAALVYNILRFVTFPGNPVSLRVCALASDPVAADLRKLDGRAIGKARLDVMLAGSATGFGTGCDIIYLDDDSPRSVGGVGRGQVLIGAGRGFAEQGGTVGLISFGGQVRFVVNSTSARRAGITVSSQLMQLAAKVVS